MNLNQGQVVDSSQKQPDRGLQNIPKVPKQSGWQETISFARTVVIFVIIAILLRGSIVEAFKIPSGSMIPTLRIGDHILVWKLSYGFRLPFRDETVYRWDSPAHGEIVVFTRPDDPTTLENESEINIIKRVIALPGDIVEVRDMKVYINNKATAEPYARWEQGGIREGNFGPVRVPPDSVLLLGDNRDHSRDSRFWTDPYLPMSRIKGRAFIIYWSWESPKRIATILR